MNALDVALRSPHEVDNGVLELILDVMESYKDDEMLQMTATYVPEAGYAIHFQ